MSEKLSERLELLTRLRRASPLHAAAETEAVWLDEAARIIRAVEDAPEALASADYEGDAQVILFSVREHYELIGKRVKLVEVTDDR